MKGDATGLQQGRNFPIHGHLGHRSCEHVARWQEATCPDPGFLKERVEGAASSRSFLSGGPRPL